MADRTIRTILTLVTDQFESGLQRAARAAQGLGDKTKQVGDASSSAMQRIAKSARENSTEWRQVGGVLTAVGAATTGLMGTVYATGISYNQLRQTSVAALTSLLGSAEAATAQMDKLDAFASTSPFARDVFIRAQQQMLAFGIEAEKVVPYLDAIQNAVAAAGGSNQDIAEIAEIFGKISASSKITAIDLQQFGRHGIDAATIIGSRMEMTGAQVRESITAGTLDARVALDALAEGMGITFEGAAAGVKDTFAGAVDRVRAAFRDISSIIAEPMVGREGGGLFTALLNQIADVLRAIEKLPAPVLQVGGALTGLGGLALTAAGGFMLLAPRMMEGWAAAVKLFPALSKLKEPLTNLTRRGLYAAGIAAIGAAFTTLGSAIARAADGGGVAALTFEEVADRLKGIEAGSENAAAAFNEMFDFGGQRGLGETIFREVLRPFGLASEEVRSFGQAVDVAFDDSIWSKTRRAWDGLLGALPGVTTDLEHARNQFEALDDAIAAAVASGDLEAATQMWETAGEELRGMGLDAEQIARILPGASQAMEELGESTQETTRATSSAADATRDYTSALQASVDMASTAAGNVLSLRDAQRRQERAIRDATDALGKNGATLDITTEAGAENAASLDAIASAGWAVIESMRESGATQDEMQASMARTREKVLEAAEGFGMSREEADLFADSLRLIPEEISVELAANTAPADEALADVLTAIAAGEESVTIDGRDFPAHQVLDSLMQLISESDAPVTIDGVDLPAQQVLTDVLGAIRDGHDYVTIDGDRVPADKVTLNLLQWMSQQNSAVQMSADTSIATKNVKDWRPPNKWIAMDADLSNARRAIAKWTPVVTAKVASIFSGLASGGYAGHLPGFAGGGSPAWRPAGLLEGPGTTTSDSILARLSRKEFVLNAAATSKLGVDAAYRLNSGRFDPGVVRASVGLADGGHAGQRYRTEYLPSPRVSVPQVQASASSLSERDVSRIAEAVYAGSRDGVLGRERLRRVVGVRANRMGGF